MYMQKKCFDELWLKDSSIELKRIGLQNVLLNQ